MQPDLFQWSPPAPVAAPTVEPTPEIERNPELAAVIKRRARKRTAGKAVAP